MAPTTLLILPIHLFNDIKPLKSFDKIIIYEEPKFFTAYNYHKQKLILHRASCMHYFDRLVSAGLNVKYIEFWKPAPKATHIYEPYDHELKKKYNCEILPSLNFLINPELVQENSHIFFDGQKYNHQKFYKWQRQRLGVLLDADGVSPLGGRWSYDTENRYKISKEACKDTPEIYLSSTKKSCISDAKAYVNTYFYENPGDDKNFIWPISHSEAKKCLSHFIKNRLDNFGKYEDASIENVPILYHSALSAPLNIGLLTDKEVLKAVLASDTAPIESKEGFVRQLIGWRNYMLAIYILSPEMGHPSNKWRHTKRMPKALWYGETGIDPIDDIIQNKILKYAYTHHIERLMYLGVWMFLNKIHPDDVYRWFMELTIDAYEWVMVPNIYGMSQNAVGDTIMKRPYICSSNYILKMSNYKKGPWCAKWDALYWQCIRENIDYFKHNYFYAAQARLASPIKK